LQLDLFIVKSRCTHRSWPARTQPRCAFLGLERLRDRVRVLLVFFGRLADAIDAIGAFCSVLQCSLLHLAPAPPRQALQCWSAFAHQAAGAALLTPTSLGLVLPLTTSSTEVARFAPGRQPAVSQQHLDQLSAVYFCGELAVGLPRQCRSESSLLFSVGTASCLKGHPSTRQCARRAPRDSWRRDVDVRTRRSRQWAGLGIERRCAGAAASLIALFVLHSARSSNP